jgi:DNA-binding XRE family transcriptional regulator
MQNHIPLEEREKYCRLLAQNLSTLREKANLTQSEIADKLGYTRVVISDYENEKRTMNWKHFAIFVLFFSNNTALREIMIALGILDEDVARVLDVNLKII